LILGGGSNVPVASQVREKIRYFRFTHVAGMPFLVIQNEAANPVAIGMLRPKTKMFSADDIADLIEEFGLVTRRRGGYVLGHAPQSANIPSSTQLR
jgi:hypothetical protein